MKKLLHIIATPRGDESRTLKVSKAFIEAFKDVHEDWEIEELDLTKETMPDLTLKRVDGKYVLLSGQELNDEQKKSWEDIVTQIERFLAADAYLISSPMWNFSVPYYLKHYIDVILQPKYLFRYTENGPEGLVKNKNMIIVTSRGGDYNTGTAIDKFDLQIPYLKTVFGLVGINDIKFINAQPMDAMGMEVQDKKIEQAISEAKAAVNSFK